MAAIDRLLSQTQIAAGTAMFHGVRKLIFPDQCPKCGALTEGEDGLCGSCWRDTPFLLGLTCDLCGTDLMGQPDTDTISTGADDSGLHCDACRTLNRPWSKGRAVFSYTGGGRGLVLQFKHGDRLDLAPTFAKWMAARGADLFENNPLLIPMPIHRRRLMKRRYNQAAVLANLLAKRTGLKTLPDALIRIHYTAPLEDKSYQARYDTVAHSLSVNPKHEDSFQGQSVVIIDDVMTTGASLAAATDLLRAHATTDVRVLTLARAPQHVYLQSDPADIADLDMEEPNL